MTKRIWILHVSLNSDLSKCSPKDASRGIVDICICNWIKQHLRSSVGEE
jgi:hypothetical protein